jgi:alkanesulfonate monooxygenase SsuD/methylene tetrahydromethanopterin reductase-like flavin-dependent oxidoreductase (luciferase family)
MARFGSVASLPVNRGGFSEAREVALRSEELGYSSVWFTDHMVPAWLSPQESELECWTLLSAMSAITRKIRLGTLVSCESFRLPSLLAKMAATVDVVSNGRLDLGIGAGWYQKDFEFLGLPFLEPSVRIERLKESIQIIKKMWTGDKMSFEGKHYRLSNVLSSHPKVVQKPHPPIWVGGKSKMVLRLAAEEADVLNLTGVTPEECARKIEALEDYCKEVGRRPSQLRKSIFIRHAVVGKNDEEVKAELRRSEPIITVDGAPLKKHLDSGIFGTPDQCIEKIQRFVDLGIGDFQIFFYGNEDQRALTFFAEKIASSF